MISFLPASLRRSALVALLLVSACQHPASTDLSIASVTDAMQAEGQGQASALLPLAALRSALVSDQTTPALDVSSLKGKSTAFYYGHDPSPTVLGPFQRVVLEPEAVDARQLADIEQQGTATFAYLSVGEVGATRDWDKQLSDAWVLGRNPAWQSRIMDISNRGWQDFLIRRASALQAMGFQGLFLDTLDSFNLVAETETERRRLAQALGQFLERLATEMPNLRIIANRGFEVLDVMAPHVEAVVAESLYAGWDNAQQRYRVVPEDDRQWLLAQLERVRQKGLDVIVIDYLPAEQRDEARAVASRIAQHGFIPWVANPELDSIGVSTLEVLPREVLLLFDSRVALLPASRVHRFLATVFEYYGYVPVYLDIANNEFPAEALFGRYAAVAGWFEHRPENPDLAHWLSRQLTAQVPILMFGAAPLEGMTSLQHMGLEHAASLEGKSLTVASKSAWMEFESPLPHRLGVDDVPLLSVGADNAVHLRIADDTGKTDDVAISGPWGAWIRSPAGVDVNLDGVAYWNIDPFALVASIVPTRGIPMPDVTTSSGRRFWMAHIDGDALPSYAEFPGKKRLGAEHIRTGILEQYRLPHSISVVEAELTELPQVRSRRPEMRETIGKMYALPHVELASHTYSHPFDWVALGKQPHSTGRYNLPIPGYRYDPKRETAGSIGFINRELAPPDKKVAVMFWSGLALPDEAALAEVRKLGLSNMNGGATVITYNNNSVSEVSPNARPEGREVQIYAPIMNENVYTRDWQGPYDGFRRVIETFELTDKPRRLKPINVYYHFYSGTKPASMRALREVYEWSTAQEINPIYTSEYSRRVQSWRRAGLARGLDGSWQLSGMESLHSLRVLDADLWPNMNLSSGFVGARRLHDGLYLHTDGRRRLALYPQSEQTRQVHLVSSNADVVSWQWRNGRLDMEFDADVPIEFVLGGAALPGCAVQAGERSLTGESVKLPGRHGEQSSTRRYRMNHQGTGHVSVVCDT